MADSIRAQRFILQAILEPELAEVHKHGGKKLPVMDYKSALQEAVHASGRPQPRYVLVKEEGPDHRKMFTMEAHVSRVAHGEKGFICRGEGSTKKAGRTGGCTAGLGASTISEEQRSAGDCPGPPADASEQS